MPSIRSNFDTECCTIYPCYNRMAMIQIKGSGDLYHQIIDTYEIHCGKA